MLSVNPVSGNTSQTITVSAITDNTSTATRTDTLTIKGAGITRTVFITQAGPSDLSVNPSSLNMDYRSGDNKTLNITSSNITWEITGKPSWLNLSHTSGSSSQSIEVTTNEENSTNDIRYATLVVSGGGFTRDVIIAQKGKPHTTQIKLFTSEAEEIHNNDTIHISYEAGSTLFNVKTNLNNWSVKDNSLSINASKENDTIIRISYTENITCNEKLSIITVSNTDGQEIKVLIKQSVNTSTCLTSIENKIFSEIRLYPNPTLETTSIYLGENQYEKFTIILTNSLGQVISIKDYQNIMPNEIIEIDLSDYPFGIYYIQLFNNNARRVFKVMKQ